MLRLMIMLLAPASVCLSAMAAAGAPIDNFVGRWSGETVQASGEPINTEMIDIEITKGHDGFELSWHDLARNEQGSLLKVTFVQTSRPGVFEVVPKPGSFLNRMFASPDAGNPLEGDTIIWARIDADVLAVYSLTIAGDGGFDLDHYTWTRTEDSLDLRYEEKTHEDRETFLVEGRLGR